jgi:hypothetical protein
MILFQIAGICALIVYGLFVLLFVFVAGYWVVCSIKGVN